MTAEIAIMNKEAVALAADSAVTLGGEKGEKIFTSANKIFALSEHHPVGIMVYGSALLMGVPWESVIKIYRAKLGAKTFSTVEKYARDFIRFLDGKNPLVPAKEQSLYVHRAIHGYYSAIRDDIVARVEAEPAAGAVSEDKLREICDAAIAQHHALWKKADVLACMSVAFRRKLREKYQRKIREWKKEIFEALPISRTASRHLTEIGLDLFTKRPHEISLSVASGVVVAGFGTDEFFPSLEHVVVEGKVLGKLKYEWESSTKIDFDNRGGLRPFAQSDMVVTFMEGVDPNYQRAIEHDLADLLHQHVASLLDKIPKLSKNMRKVLQDEFRSVNQCMVGEYRKGLRDYRWEKFVEPLIGVVSVLPKDELAEMAESLVRLIAFKKRVTMESETVAEPIDVAVISKGDGFVWVRRKHYFDPALNPRFLAKHYKGEAYGRPKDK